jgi:glycosyltransferase involved in cell wall biosynthesis
MARIPDPLALDDAQGGGMTAARNAAIWYAPDGFDPAKGVNGRRMAGDSFIRGWFRHAAVDEFVALTHGPSDEAAFRALAEDCGASKPVRVARLENAPAMRPLGTVFFSGPNYATEVWRREVWGMASHSVCGITHTISTKAVMEGAWHLRTAPQAEWDAIICTSRAVKSAVSLQMDLIDGFLARRFGSALPARLQLPVIPLGIDTAAFQPDAAAGLALRDRLGIAAEDVVALVIARLSPHEKFDPLPLFLALQQAQEDSGTRLHLMVYGSYPDSYSRQVFETGARALMPAVSMHHLEHEGAALRLAALSAAQMFLFPIDNLQESFGIAPVEAMAAGLPVVASDWDGLRDTVSDEAGIRIRTLGLAAEHVAGTALRYHGGTDNYIQYLSQMSAMTQVDVGQMAQAIRGLMLNPDLRARMGKAGQKRAQTLFDWAAVVPQMQDLFAELGAIRAAADPKRFPPTPASLLPTGPSPMAYFSSFPTEQIKRAGPERYVMRPIPNPLPVRDTWNLRNYAPTRRIFEPLADIEKVAAAVEAAASDGAASTTIAEATGISVLRVERCLLWLLKYDYVERGAG